jgi:hypothetical protein
LNDGKTDVFNTTCYKRNPQEALFQKFNPDPLYLISGISCQKMIRTLQITAAILLELFTLLMVSTLCILLGSLLFITFLVIMTIGIETLKSISFPFPGDMNHHQWKAIIETYY